MNASKRNESKRENLFHHSIRLTTDHYDATIAYAYPIEQKTSSVLEKQKHRDPLIVIDVYVRMRACVYTFACVCSRQVFIRLYRFTLSAADYLRTRYCRPTQQ